MTKVTSEKGLVINNNSTALIAVLCNVQTNYTNEGSINNTNNYSPTGIYSTIIAPQVYINNK